MRLGGWKNTLARFSCWAKSGVWAQIFAALSADADDEYAVIDDALFREHQHCGGAGKRGGEVLGRRGAG